MFDLALLSVGLLILLLSADRLIAASVTIARRHRIPEVLVGITLISMGTTLPELAVSMSAVYKGGATEIILSNVIGSNIVNGLLVIGILAVSRSVLIERSIVRRELIFGIGASLLVFIMVLDHILDGEDQLLGRTDGILLLTYFGLFLFHIIKKARSSQLVAEKSLRRKPSRLPLIFIGSLIGVIVGGQMTINGALGISSTFGLTQTFVGAVILAIGTSLPELSLAVLALKRNNIDIAVGNVIGANLFNILGVLGLSAMLTPIVVSSRITLDIIFLIFSSSLLFALAYIGAPAKIHRLTRSKGALLIFVYGCFLLLSISLQS